MKYVYIKPRTKQVLRVLYVRDDELAQSGVAVCDSDGPLTISCILWD